MTKACYAAEWNLRDTKGETPEVNRGPPWNSVRFLSMGTRASDKSYLAGAAGGMSDERGAQSGTTRRHP